MTSASMTRREFVGCMAFAPVFATIGAKHMSREHVVVVGAGAFGGWTALALLRAGLQVTLVDAWGAGHSRASSGGETRVIRAVYGGVPIYSEMAVRAFVLWGEEQQRWQRQVLFPTGSLWLCNGDDGYVRRSLAPMKTVGLTLEEISIEAAARRYPQMSFRDVRTVFYEPSAGFITARAACEQVRDSFIREGGAYRQAWVRVGARAGGRVTNITLSDGTTLNADRFVFACGPWLPQVFPDVVGRRVVATRQEVFFFATPPGDTRYDTGTLPVWVHIGDRFVYGLANHERRGLKIADDTAGVEVDPTTMDRTPTADGIARARNILRDRFPALADAPLLEARVCQYEASSDGHFLIDRHPQYENAWLVGGGSGHGFKMGPALGEHVAALVQGKAAVHPLFAYGRLKPRP